MYPLAPESSARSLNACPDSTEAASLLLAQAIADLPFTFQVWWLGRCRQRERYQALRLWSETHCLECGYLKEKGHSPDCGHFFYPSALTLKCQEPGIIHSCKYATE